MDEKLGHAVEVMAGMLRGLQPEADEARVQAFARVAGDAYLKHAEELSPEERNSSFWLFSHEGGA